MSYNLQLVISKKSHASSINFKIYLLIENASKRKLKIKVKLSSLLVRNNGWSGKWSKINEIIKTLYDCVFNKNNLKKKEKVSL